MTRCKPGNSALARALLREHSIYREKLTMRLRSILVLAMLGLGGLACSKDDPDQEEVTTGDENTAEQVGQDIDEAADETTDEIGHVGNDRDETVDEAQDKVDEATGAD